MSLEVQLFKLEEDLPKHSFVLAPGKFQDVLGRHGNNFFSFIFYCLPDDSGARVYQIPWDVRSSPHLPKPLWRPEFVDNPEDIESGGVYARLRYDRGNMPFRLIAEHHVGDEQQTLPHLEEQIVRLDRSED